jgi:2-haloacid dehalogenase
LRAQKKFLMIKNVLFDLGAVLIDWNPRYMYRKVFETEEAIDHFLNHVCTFHWNEEQDGGRTIEEATRLKIAEFPQYTKEIKMYYDRWEEMLGGPIQPSVDLLNDCLKDERYGVYALTNWSAETWPKACEIFEFLNRFDGILVSGQEKLKKPDPAIFTLTAERFNLEPSSTLFIDDNPRNIKTADEMGFQTIHFTSVERVANAREKLGLG